MMVPRGLAAPLIAWLVITSYLGNQRAAGIVTNVKVYACLHEKYFARIYECTFA